MKRWILISIVYPFISLSAQSDKPDVANQIDKQVEIIETKKGYRDSFEISKQFYEYKAIDKKIVKIYYKHKKDPRTTLLWTFYINNNNEMIFARENVVFGNGEDAVYWSGYYYFDKGELIYYSSLGHGKSEVGPWEPKKEAPTMLDKIRNKINSHINKKKIKETSQK